MQNNLQVIVEYRIQQAHQTTKEIETLIARGSLSLAINRIYFSMFYALQALAMVHNTGILKYTEIREWFNNNFVKQGKVDRFYGKILHNAYEDKTEGDYGLFVSFEKEEVVKKFQDMKIFVAEIENLLSDDIILSDIGN